MSKRIKNGEGQTDLHGQIVKEEELIKNGDVPLMKSALQKYIRRGNVEKAMYWDWRLGKVNWNVAWKRLLVITVEDCLNPVVVSAIGELHKMFMAHKREDKRLGWNELRCIVAAAKILAESEKDRSVDEFLEMMEVIERYGDKDEEVKKKKEELEKLDEFVFDMHTAEGRKAGRGLEYWYEESSKVANPSKNYVHFNEWVWNVIKRLGW